MRIEFDEYRLKINDLEPRMKELEAALAIDAAQTEVAQLHEQSTAQDFWSDMETAQKTLQKAKTLENKIAKFEKMVGEWEDLQVLCEMAIEAEDDSLLDEIVDGYKKLDTKLDNARLETLLSGEYDSNNAIVSFHAGAGGTEAQDWCEMLYRMITHWAEAHNYKYELMDYLEGEEAGLKSAVISVQGENAYGYLKSESGIHRLVRISPYDSSGRRHTSFSAIEVIPEIEDDGSVEIRPEDIKMDVFRSSGAGGQHINKTSSAVRLTHIPTGIVVASQQERSQFQNRENCMKQLRSKLVEIKERQHLEKISDIKGVQMKIEWGSQIRSYVFMPYTLAKDHRTGFENGNIQAVMDGELDGFMSAYLTCSATGEWATK